MQGIPFCVSLSRSVGPLIVQISSPTSKGARSCVVFIRQWFMRERNHSFARFPWRITVAAVANDYYHARASSCKFELLGNCFFSQLGLPRRVLIQLLKDQAAMTAAFGSPSSRAADVFTCSFGQFPTAVSPAKRQPVRPASDSIREAPDRSAQPTVSKGKLPSESSQVNVLK